VEWLRKLFRREDVPPEAPDRERINPLPAETALQWSAEDQQSGEDEAGALQEGDEPKPRRTL
jgi:hypothetical protein